MFLLPVLAYNPKSDDLISDCDGSQHIKLVEIPFVVHNAQIQRQTEIFSTPAANEGNDDTDLRNMLEYLRHWIQEANTFVMYLPKKSFINFEKQAQPNKPNAVQVFAVVLFENLWKRDREKNEWCD